MAGFGTGREGSEIRDYCPADRMWCCTVLGCGGPWAAGGGNKGTNGVGKAGSLLMRKVCVTSFGRAWGTNHVVLTLKDACGVCMYVYILTCTNVSNSSLSTLRRSLFVQFHK